MAGWTVDDMVRGFRDAGLGTGDSLIVHSSFKSLGPVEGGPEAVIDALIEAVGPTGNVVFPTFNYTANIPDPCFDPATNKCLTGIIPELARQRPNAIRSLHPTHSIAVIGPDAQELTRDHLATRTVGIGGPIDRLAKRGGKVLLLGVGNTSNTTIHTGEEYAGTPKVGWTEVAPIARVLLPDGRIVEHVIDSSTSCSRGFGALDAVLEQYGEMQAVTVGSALVRLMLGEDVIKRVQEMIARRPDVLLCDNPKCRPCTGTRANLRSAGLL